MVIKKEIEFNSTIEKAWQILAKDFAHPHKWASPVNHSEGLGKQLPSINCDERACQTKMGELREKITHLSDEQHTITWDIVSGMPPFVEKASSTWNLKKQSEQKTLLEVKMNVTLRSWAFPMTPMAKMMFNKMAFQLSEDFAHYAEKGKPHPRKVKAINKHQSGNKGLSRFYFFAFLLGSAIPLYFIIQFVRDAGGIDLVEFVNQLFANYAASTFSADLLICSFIFWIFMANEQKKHRTPNMGYFILLNLTIGLSTAMPLYLFFREKGK